MVFDKVHELAKQMRDSDEYKAYAVAKDKAHNNVTNIALLKEYHKITMEGQAFLAIGKQPPEELSDKIKKIYEVLMLSNECMAYLVAEYTLNRMVGDIFKILTDAVEVDMNFLSD